MVSPKRTRRPPPGSGDVVDLGAVGERGQPVGDVEGDREHRLAVGLVEAREGAPGVGGFELRGGDGVGRRRRSSVKAER